MDSTTTHRTGPAFAQQSYADFLTDRMARACDALGIVRGLSRPVLREVRSLLDPWGRQPIGTRSRYPSAVSHDGFPAELSVNWSDGPPQVRILFESLGGPMTPLSCRRAGVALNGRLAARPGVSLDRYLKIEDLVLPAPPEPGPGLIWHSLAWTPGRSPQYKVYFSAQARGRAHSHHLVEEAMGRLGLSTAWSHVRGVLGPSEDQEHELEFLALDLSDTPRSRVKVYYRHHAPTAAVLNRVAGLSGHHDSERATAAYRRILGDAMVRQSLPIPNEPLTCLAFLQDHDIPVEATTYLRLPGLVGSDEEARGRVSGLMEAEGIDPAPYRSMIESLAPGPLSRTTGLQELVSVRCGRRTPDVTLYLRFAAYPSD
ncbi:tryptophan dimethylallyltransferase family protein [Streptomyces sp. NPDC050856]|uniref:tryptophan dimethylallyltransferase family protein n=1 Tax=Streptomyces sp. NPDC050856 TaxID=3154939 RepID=UPI00341177BD